MKKCILFLFFCFSASIVPAQSAFVKAYIVNDKGDTLKGEAKVNPKKEIDNYYKVTFKDETGMQKIYKPNKLKGYGFNGENFCAMDWEEEKRFYKILVTGDINFYKLGYETMRMNEVVFEVEYYMSHAGDKELVLIKESKFKKLLGEWTKDNPDIIAEYGEEKKFDPDKAIETITHYNSWKTGK